MSEDRFYTNKYPIAFCIQVGDGTNNTYEPLPTGHVFTIGSISGDFVDLMPVSNIKGMVLPVQVSVSMLHFGFTASKYISQKPDYKSAEV